ncbi:MAG: hypothetical protein A2033_12720 [Bacteroidetes bacterium GWA2_31_9]|nr:MAG: hypothetical protein A2033_12720 [Bacteroidetes bacterium GWA2_31_9]
MYTIIISDDKSIQAQKLLMFLKSLTQTADYNFLQIIEEKNFDVSKETKNELDFRYKHFLKHYNEYSDWDDIKQKYLKQ